MRAAVDLEQQRILPPGLEARRLHDPAVHACSAARGDPQLLEIAELDVGQHVLVDARQAGEAALPQVDARDIRRLLGRGPHPGADPVFASEASDSMCVPFVRRFGSPPNEEK